MERNYISQMTRIFFNRFRRPILLGLAIIVLLLGYFLIIKNPLTVYRQNWDLLGGLDSDIALAETELSNAKSYSSQLYQLTPQDERLLDMALPQKPDFSSIVEQLTSLANHAGFIVNNIDFNEAKASANKAKPDDLGRISIHLQVTGGGYTQLKELIKLLESSVMMLDTYSLNFANTSPTYDLNLVVYYYNKS